MSSKQRLSILVLATAFGPALAAAEWPHWRGPNYNGSTTAKDLPVRFGPAENVRWKAVLPGPAGSTPIVTAGRVFLTAFDRAMIKVVAFAFDRQTGDMLWRRELGEGEDDRTAGMENFMAAPSPVADENTVFFFTGAGDLAAFNFDGKERWRWNLQERYGSLNIMHGYGSSPVLVQDRLFIQVLHRDERYPDQKPSKLQPESFLLGVDPRTGEVAYRQVRATDASGEAREAYSTPIPRFVDGRVELLVLGADYLTAHDPATGKELWRHGSLNPQNNAAFRFVPSPLVGNGLIYAAAPFHGPVTAIEVFQGKTRTKWQLERNTTDTPTPIFYEGKLFVLDGKKRVLSCVDPASGKVQRRSRLPGDRYIRASPTAADGKIYIMNAEGEVFVLSARDSVASESPDKVPGFRLLHQADMGDYPARSSIAIAHDNLFVRTADALFCIGSTPEIRESTSAHHR